MTTLLASVPATAIVERLDAGGFHKIVTVPDFVQLSVHDLIDKTPNFQVIRCSDENQAIHVAGGLHIGGHRVAVLIQNQGLLNCLNSLRAVGLDAGLSMLLMIGQFGREYSNVGNDPSLSRRRVVNLVEPVLDVMGIDHWRLDGPQDLPNIDMAIESCAARSGPAAVLIGHYTAWN
ncbi:thiamine pyrophosphate-binding protein [Achromobacter pestifer]|uniref:Thiamine pyrophosphate-binding protein n=1 Tax=Achromobacter pestifer TaxID=1353889 RepID=A0A7D4E001_9BURK|nr:thiamine pyrophosphate-binding protein [Achromobacter pestifer]QKH36827.1 thiamine pyrophosphate-binding protein [Achromobacter pestifer]